jgi:hypothetical protein
MVINERIKEFKARIINEEDYCKELYTYATIRLLAAKYGYYIMSETFIEDKTYDIEEDSWYVMGRALDALKEDETSPCIGFDEQHPLAIEAIQYYETMPKRR